MANSLSSRVYSAGRRWVWVVQEYGSTLCSGTAHSKDEALIQARHARREIEAVTPGGLSLLGSKHGRRRELAALRREARS